jgi:excinuclease ABC subunit C
MVMDSKHMLGHKLALLPERPGCYLMKDAEGTIIYVGKANVLKNRVRSYFTGTHEGKTQRLVEHICDFETIVTTNELEAFILECNLIKQYRPKYNVLLKDDKTFPYIKITAEKHPRLEIVRKVLRDQARYFGPYPNAYAATRTKQLLDRLYPLRKCKTMPREVCLYYHMKQCLAPCVYTLPPDAESDIVEEIARFLRGGHKEVRARLQEQMERAAEELHFERAKDARDTIAAIDALMERQHISAAGGDEDVFGYAVASGWMAVHIFFVREGKITSRNVAAFPYYGEEYSDFLTYIAQYYSDNPERPPTIAVPEGDVDAPQLFAQAYQLRVIVPKIGVHAQRVRLACDNAAIALDGHLRLLALKQERSEHVRQELHTILGLPRVQRIEIFDNSHIQGNDAVSAMVVWNDGVWDKSACRKFLVRTTDGADDYAMVREVMRRRYTRALREGQTLPDAIFIDGGKGHVGAARSVVFDELGIAVPIFGLAKDERHRFSTLVGGVPPVPIPISREHGVFHLLQHMQDEVHRVAIAFHQRRRSRRSFDSVLDHIQGVGDKRKQRILKTFGSVRALRNATVEQLRDIGIGAALAQRILDSVRGDQRSDKQASSSVE